MARKSLNKEANLKTWWGKNVANPFTRIGKGLVSKDLWYSSPKEWAYNALVRPKTQFGRGLKQIGSQFLRVGRKPVSESTMQSLKGAAKGISRDAKDTNFRYEDTV